MDLRICTWWTAPEDRESGNSTLLTLATLAWDGSWPLPKVADTWVHNGITCIISYVRIVWTFKGTGVRGIATMLILPENELISRTNDRWWETTEPS